MARIRASVGILTLNSAETLHRALHSVRDFEDIVLCDGGSTDATLSIAAEYGARVVPQPPEAKDGRNRLINFGTARNALLDAARCDWFLWLDSDETVSEGLREEIRRITQNPLTCRAYRVPLGILLDGRYVRYSSNYPGYQLRFFTREGRRFIKPVHERITVDPEEPVGTLAHPWYIHTTQDDWKNYLTDGRGYRTIAVRTFASEPWPRLGRILYRNLRAAIGVLLRASRNYFLHGFKDAIPLRGELGRFLDPLALTARILYAKVTGARPPETSERLAYVAYTRMPSERAHGLQIVKTCEALARAGEEVELIVPLRKNALSGSDPFAYYGLERAFSVTYLPVPDLVAFGPLGFLASTRLFSRAVRRHLQQAPPRLTVSRDERVLAHLSGDRIWESHTGSWSGAARKVARDALRVVVLTQPARAYYETRGVPAGKLAVVPDGVDLGPFSAAESRAAARARLGLPEDAPVALYVGDLGGWKGVETLAAAATTAHEVRFVVIGGREEAVRAYRERYPALLLLGARPYTELADNLSAGDVLVLPNTGQSDISRYFTSPLKLFAYMAAGKPIVASDTPSMRDVLDDDSAFLVPPDDPGALARAIRGALGDPLEGARRAARARLLVEEYTWDRRAQKLRSLFP